MNVYLLFALAFGALNGGAAEVRVPRALTVTIRVRDERRVSVAGDRLRVMRFTDGKHRRPATGNPFVVIAPLRGSISPRAPAATC